MDTVCSLQIRYNAKWVESYKVKVFEGQVETMKMKTDDLDYVCLPCLLICYCELNAKGTIWYLPPPNGNAESDCK